MNVDPYTNNCTRSVPPVETFLTVTNPNFS